MNIKLVIFDLDGTLVNAYKAVCRGLNKVLEELGYPKADDLAIRRSVGWGEDYLMRAFVREQDLNRAVDLYRQYHKQALARGGVSFEPGAGELLEQLHAKGYLLSVATNRPEWSAQIILETLDIDRFFSFKLFGDSVVNHKPDKEILEKTLAYFELDAKEAVYVGDMTVDVQTGHAAGIKTIATPTGSSTREEVEALAPFQIAADLFEVVDIIEDLSSSAETPK